MLVYVLALSITTKTLGIRQQKFYKVQRRERILTNFYRRGLKIRLSLDSSLFEEWNMTLLFKVGHWQGPLTEPIFVVKRHCFYIAKHQTII